MDEPRSRSGSGGALALTVAAVALLAVTVGTRSVFGLFLSPLNSATGLGVATISFAIAVSQLTWGVAQPFAGMLAERIGAARVILGGTLLAAAVGAIFPFAHGAPMLVAVFALGGVAATVGSPSLLIGIVSQRVPAQQRGMVAGLIGSGGPLGQLVLAPATQVVISLAGWVNAALALAALALASLPLALAFRRPAAPARTAAAASDSLRKALNSPHYWIINATFFVCGLHVFFLMTHLPGVIELCGLPSNVSGLSLAALAVAWPAAAQGPGRVEAGASLVNLAIVFPGEQGDKSILFGLPSGSFGLLSPSVYASIFAGPRLAIEPQVRRRTPELLIGWARVLQGKLSDPRVGRDVLVGVLFGAGSMLIIDVVNALPTWLPFHAQTPVPPNMDSLEGGRILLGAFLSMPSDLLVPAFGLFGVWFVLRLMLKRPLWAAIGLAIVMTLLVLGAENPVLEVPGALIQGTLIAWVITRYGLLALIASSLMRALFLTTPLPFTPSSPYAFQSMLCLGLTLVLVGWAFRVSLGGRPALSLSLDE